MYQSNLTRVAVSSRHTFLPRFLREGAIVVDLGGNRGKFAAEVSDALPCRCVVVEPSPTMFDRIPESPRTSKFRYAIAGQNGPVTFYVAKNSVMSGMFQEGTDEVSEVVHVEGIRLEDFCRRHGVDHIDLLKVDIEGAEVAMFDSMSDEFLASIPQITVEFHDFTPMVTPETVRRIRKRVERLGFSFLKFSGRYQTDVLLVNRKLCKVSRAELFYLRCGVRNILGISRLLRRKFDPSWRE